MTWTLQFRYQKRSIVSLRSSLFHPWIWILFIFSIEQLYGLLVNFILKWTTFYKSFTAEFKENLFHLLQEIMGEIRLGRYWPLKKILLVKIFIKLKAFPSNTLQISCYTASGSTDCNTIININGLFDACQVNLFKFKISILIKFTMKNLILLKRQKPFKADQVQPWLIKHVLKLHSVYHRINHKEARPLS